jgi:hypothetical protein
VTFGFRNMVLLLNKDFVFLSDGFFVTCFMSTSHETSDSFLAGMSVVQDIGIMDNLSILPQEGYSMLAFVSIFHQIGHLRGTTRR